MTVPPSKHLIRKTVHTGYKGGYSMFGQRKKSLTLLSPVTGKVIPLENSEDKAFAEKLVGDGVAIMPVDGDFRSPANGRISGVAEALHAYSIETEEGLDLLVHIGIDTVGLGGRGYVPAVKAGDTVKAGDPLCKVDIELLKSLGYSLCTPVVICDADRLSSISPFYGDAIGGADTVIEYTVKGRR